MTASQIIVALTLFYEANSTLLGVTTVAAVIHRRAAGDPQRYVAVCRAPKQFSCWNGRDALTIPTAIAERDRWQLSARTARDMHEPDYEPIIKADHYHAISIKPPKWAANMEAVGEFAGHRFYLSNRKWGGR